MYIYTEKDVNTGETSPALLMSTPHLSEDPKKYFEMCRNIPLA